LLPKIESSSKKYITANIDKFIGDASYPEKKNKLEQMDDEIRNGIKPEVLAKKYGWMRARDGFARGYSVKEIIEHSKEIKKSHPHIYPSIPPALLGLFKEARELVYLRTRRTDVYFELLFLARPILKAIAKKYKINFNELKYYTAHSLISGRPKKYPKNFSGISYKDKLFFFKKPILSNLNKNKDQTEIKGTTAQPGIIKGIAKIVLRVSELNKVKKGDILVTYMTSPNFLPAMKLSAAFVTNEGGLTCHAAIIAREIKKPCVIGTRIATEIFKDGDLIEVNADKGVVKLLRRGK
jgi:phosphoenolpyruvate synthase/pyruvate phosphate dikinase